MCAARTHFICALDSRSSPAPLSRWCNADTKWASLSEVMSLPRLKSSFLLLIISFFPMLVFTWGYLTLSAEIRQLASQQAALEDTFNNLRLFASTTAQPPRINGFVNLWSSLNFSALPRSPDGCSDAVCSNFAPDGGASELLCAKISSARLSKNKRVSPICRFQNGTARSLYLLRSYPGSGNTWVRQVLERITGICTGLVKEHLLKGTS